MKKVHVVNVLTGETDVLEFSDGSKLYSEHEADCCELHYLSLVDLNLNDFDGLEFDLSSKGFFKRIPDYGIELIPLNGHSVKIPGYGHNNGYYSSELTLILTQPNGEFKSFDISDCQVISD